MYRGFMDRNLGLECVAPGRIRPAEQHHEFVPAELYRERPRLTNKKAGT
jgi:hypothetical protein